MADNWRVRVAEALVTLGAVGFVPDAPVRFKSGILSPIYIDNRRLPYHPQAWHTVIDGFRAIIEATSLPFDVVAGVAVGGVPHSAALAYTLNRPSVFVRKEAKEHGTKRLVEGGDVAGRQVLLVEDLVTSGGSSLDAVRALRAEEATVTDVLAIVGYGFAEARQAFAEAKVALHTLTDFQAILAVALERNSLSPDVLAVVEDWIADPYGWAARQGLV